MLPNMRLFSLILACEGLAAGPSSEFALPMPPRMHASLSQHGLQTLPPTVGRQCNSLPPQHLISPKIPRIFPSQDAATRLLGASHSRHWRRIILLPFVGAVITRTSGMRERAFSFNRRFDARRAASLWFIWAIKIRHGRMLYAHADGSRYDTPALFRIHQLRMCLKSRKFLHSLLAFKILNLPQPDEILPPNTGDMHRDISFPSAPQCLEEAAGSKISLGSFSRA